MLILPDQCTETTTSITEPITTAYAKSHLRVDISDDDTLIGNLVTAAREYAEKYCGRSFVTHTYRADLPGFYSVIEFPFQPVQSVDSVKYFDTASPQVLQTWASTNYRLVNNRLERVSGANFPAYSPRANAVQVTFTTGWRDNSSPQGSGADVPEAVKSAILMMVGALYEHREAELMYPGQLHQVRTFHALLNAYRLYQ